MFSTTKILETQQFLNASFITEELYWTIEYLVFSNLDHICQIFSPNKIDNIAISLMNLSSVQFLEIAPLKGISAGSKNRFPVTRKTKKTIMIIPNCPKTKRGHPGKEKQWPCVVKHAIGNVNTPNSLSMRWYVWLGWHVN